MKGFSKSLKLGIAIGGVTLAVTNTPLVAAEPGDALVPPPSVYAPKELPRADAGTNAGGVHIDVSPAYVTDYVYRGIEISEGLTTFTDPLALVAPGETGTEDAPNLQFDAKLSFDLGKAPHPFVGVFVNVFDADPLSRFQEVRPYFGVDWYLKPLTVTLGHNTYLFPEREPLNTSEAYVRIGFDDSTLWKTDRGVFNPYVLAAYDYDTYRGWYFEVGVHHDIPIPDTGLTVTFYSDIAYVTTHQFFAITPGGTDSGFQHYDVGMLVRFDFNEAFKLGRRYGTWALEGQLTYTDNVENDLRADTQLWGGVALKFGY
ncbi:MAG TPA: hypothetical protein VK324_15320 [Tepidisphaeraceae bacterium]|nr:hypothetical protein [Tepidisphaeraceae bacterium]